MFKCLIVEDDTSSRKLMEAYLSGLCQCDMACDGASAVAAVERAWADGQPYRLICLDIMMPEMDGHEVLRRIRELEDSHGADDSTSARVIMTTALQESGHILKAYRRGCESYLVKPINKAALHAELEHLGLVSGVSPAAEAEA